MVEWKNEFQYLLDRKMLSCDELAYLFGQIKSIVDRETGRLKEALECASRILNKGNNIEPDSICHFRIEQALKAEEQ